MVDAKYYVLVRSMTLVLCIFIVIGIVGTTYSLLTPYVQMNPCTLMFVISSMVLASTFVISYDLSRYIYHRILWELFK
jgi:hypothetical protein